MAYFAVTREPGPAWDRSRPLREQAGWDEHAAFMDALADEGVVALGGPLGDDAENRLTEVLLIVRVGGESAAREPLACEREIRTRLDQDPWVAAGLLTTSRVALWHLLIGDLAAEAARGS